MSSAYRPTPPKPARLNHTALLAAAIVAGVTACVVLWSAVRPVAPDHPTAPRPVAAQRPSFPSPTPDTSHRVAVRPVSSIMSAPLPQPVPTSYTRALVSAPLVRTARERAPASDAPPSTAPHAQFLSAAERLDTSSSVHALDSPYTVQTGTVVSVALVTEIRSTIPGQVVAQVTRDVYDTPRQRWVLVPRGSRLIGRYDTQVGRGEDALLVVWTRLLFPDGRSMALPGFEAGDESGTAGLRGAVDTHIAHAYIDAALLSLVGAAGQLSQPNAGAGAPYTTPSAGQVVAGSFGEQISERTLEMLRADAQLTPVITVRGGTSFVVLVARDLVFDEPYGTAPSAAAR